MPTNLTRPQMESTSRSVFLSQEVPIDSYRTRKLPTFLFSDTDVPQNGLIVFGPRSFKQELNREEVVHVHTRSQTSSTLVSSFPDRLVLIKNCKFTKSPASLFQNTKIPYVGIVILDPQNPRKTWSTKHPPSSYTTTDHLVVDCTSSTPEDCPKI